MADHRLRRADRDLVGVGTVGRLDRLRLGRVVELGRGAVGHDVVDLVGGDAECCRASVMARAWPRPSDPGR